jgi:hypothetical protein
MKTRASSSAKTLGRAEPDAGAATGHDGDLAFEFLRHAILSFSPATHFQPVEVVR